MKNANRHEAGRRGFTLTEIAIVLGIAGVIFAAIWGAASSVREKADISRASEQLGLIATSIQSMYAGRNETFANMNSAHALNAAPSTSDFAYYMGIYTAVTGNIFPTEMLFNGGAVDPWSGTVQAALAGVANNPVQFVIEYQGIPADACTALVANNSMPGRETGLMKIVISSGATTWGPYCDPSLGCASTLPVSVGTLGSVCTAANAPFTIDWYYKLGQGCAAGSPC